MKTVLAIDTSTAQGSLALLRDGETLFSATFVSERTHNAVLFAPLAEALKLAPEIQLIVVGIGPGSYTGVRVGIAAALGISMARNIPLIGWNSLAAVAANSAHFATVGDARRGMFHFSELRGHRIVSGPHLETAEAIAARCGKFGGAIYTTDSLSPPFCDAQVSAPSAERLAEIGAALSEEECTALAALPLEPIYLSPPFITTARKTK